MAREYSHEIAAAVNDFLTDDDWKFWFDDKRGVFRFTLTIGAKVKIVNYSVFIDEDAYTVYATFPIGAPKGDSAILARLAEFTCRANYGLRNGNFELDFRDGELQYKTFVDCEDLIPSRAVVANSIRATAMMCDRYADAILAAVFTEDSIAEAVEKCENRGHEDMPSPEELEAMLAALKDESGDDDDDSSLDELKALLDSLGSDDQPEEDD